VSDDSTTYHWRVSCTNDCEAGAWTSSHFELVFCAVTLTGDVDTSGALTAADIIYLVGYVFKSGPPPLPQKEAGDVNCSGIVTSADIVYMVNHVFRGQAPPCDICTILD
jgi:hypothetical protein